MRSIRGSSKGWFALRRKPKPTKSKLGYQQRKIQLAFLGYPNYHSYLQGKEWAAIRERHLKRFKFCVLCGAKAREIHHLAYDCETLLGLIIWRLVQLCHDCHQKIEFNGAKKRRLRGANTALFRLAEESERGRKWIGWYENERGRYRNEKERKRKQKHKEHKTIVWKAIKAKHAKRKRTKADNTNSGAR